MDLNPSNSLYASDNLPYVACKSTMLHDTIQDIKRNRLLSNAYIRAFPSTYLNESIIVNISPCFISVEEIPREVFDTSNVYKN